MDIKQYLDSTYLKTAEQAGLSENENIRVAREYIQEAIDEHFKLIMVRPNVVSIAKEMITQANSVLEIGTVIDFPDGIASIKDKLQEAQKAIEDGADDLDFVCNYKAFINGEIDIFKEEILRGTQLGLANNKVVKWIIEVAALEEKEIIQICSLIKNVVVSNFEQELFSKVFVKSSTGFYKTKNNEPNGATIPTVKMMLDNASPLAVKAAGGVRTYQEAVAMIDLGVKRIGTSGAKMIAAGQNYNNEY
ncbi:deoxyribose-phosphate aldolase [Flavobacterium micromati]|uniref:Deoxyribose-phosphate aldolase n=1 Tax=Flavobacterium micromati TaxID=229205 RepID=A0A1M5FG38_9FLAO|nr:deoxyribose-phosphate aldolase [Flavobacterium micromati]SHF90122.1 deoxyribose-phosphate aldolase [Flavobacterium micromati]